MRLIVYFDGQFWNGLIEREVNNSYTVQRHIFGAEPKDGEIEEFVNVELVKYLCNLNNGEEIESITARKINPKRLKKLVAKEVQCTSVSTKAQQALQQALEANKKEKAQADKHKLLELEKYKRSKAVEKRKQKHRGH